MSISERLAAEERCNSLAEYGLRLSVEYKNDAGKVTNQNLYLGNTWKRPVKNWGTFVQRVCKEFAHILEEEQRADGGE